MKKNKKQVKNINYRMSRIRSKNTRIEKKIRSMLWSKGFRYRIHYKELPGSPDIVFVRHKIAIFCDSEFWHGRNWNTKKNKLFKKNKEFWENKIKKNIERDKRVNNELKKIGWKVIRFWGNQIEHKTERCIDIIKKAIIIKEHQEQ
jgi:DNA mismatch endonuclease (patch repair protein)